MEILIAVAGLIVMVMVVAGMVLLTPQGTEVVRTSYEDEDEAGPSSELSPQPVQRRAV